MHAKSESSLIVQQEADFTKTASECKIRFNEVERIVQENLWSRYVYGTPLCNFMEFISDSFSLHKRADTGPAAGLLPFYGPVQLSLCNGLSSGMSSMLLKLY